MNAPFASPADLQTALSYLRKTGNPNNEGGPGANRSEPAYLML